ncbi:MAG: hypothetical protein VX633_02165, partial [Verrucomicrobiota bacterium]|nr:hypothetical protein [Verrucomicrobiota bacterium]
GRSEGQSARGGTLLEKEASGSHWRENRSGRAGGESLKYGTKRSDPCRPALRKSQARVRGGEDGNFSGGISKLRLGESGKQGSSDS